MTRQFFPRVGLLAAALLVAAHAGLLRAADLQPIIRTAQPMIVKVHGAGGYRGLEAYQSGFLFSPPKGMCSPRGAMC